MPAKKIGVTKIKLSGIPGRKPITLTGEDLNVNDVRAALNAPPATQEPRSAARQAIDRAFGIDPDAVKAPATKEEKAERARFAASLSARLHIPKRRAARLRREIDAIIEGVFAMSGSFCLDVPDERAALADVLAVDLCHALPELAALLGKEE